MKIIEKIKSILNRNNKSDLQKKKRRGLYTVEYSMVDTLSKAVSGHINVEYELEEIERSPKKSKVKVVSYVTSKGKLTKSQMEEIEILINNKWIDSNLIEWVYDFDEISEKREEKINEILK